MSRIPFGPFSGMRPRVAARFLGETEAQLARNCDLGGGELRPIMAPLERATLAKTGTVQTLYQWGEGSGMRWLQFAGVVDVVRGQVPDDATEKTYFTDGVKPRVTNSALVDVAGNDEYPESSYVLAIPTPTAALTATPSGSGGTGDDRQIVYVFTFVREWPDGTYDEGAPSPVSSGVDALDGETVNLSDLPISAGAGNPSNVTHKYVYRRASGINDAVFAYVGKVALATTTLADAVTDTNLGKVLPSTDWDTPPDDLFGLVAHPCGSLVGLSGNMLCFSDPDHPHAWPVDYRFSLDFPGVGLAVVGTTVMVMTSGYPYLCSGNAPAYMTPPEKLPVLAPCTSRRGIVSTPYGAVYPCPSGLMLLGIGQWSLAAQDWITTREWEQYQPATILGTFHDGKYVGFFGDGAAGSAGFIFDLAEGRFGELGLYAQAVHVDPRSGRFYLLENDPVTGLNYVKEWGKGETALACTWRSRVVAFGQYVNMGVVEIEADWPSVLTEEQQAAWEAARQALMEANEALFLAGPTDILAGCSGAPCSMFPCAADNRTAVAAAYVEPEGVRFRWYSESGVLRCEFMQNTAGVRRMPAGYKDKANYMEVSGKLSVRRVTVATSVEELAG